MADTQFVSASIQTSPVVDFWFIILLALFLVSLVIIFFMIKTLISPKKLVKKLKYSHELLYERPEKNSTNSTIEMPKRADEDETEQYSIMKKLETQSKLDEGIEKYLKEDEKEIVNILKLKDGMCDQGMIVNLTGYSKAKVSEIIAELYTRKVILKKKKGRKNIIMLRNL